MTKIGDTKLLVIGGFSRQNYFSEYMYEYDAAISSWKKYDQHTDLIGAPVGMCCQELFINLLSCHLFLILPEIGGMGKEVVLVVEFYSYSHKTFEYHFSTCTLKTANQITVSKICSILIGCFFLYDQ